MVILKITINYLLLFLDRTEEYCKTSGKYNYNVLRFYIYISTADDIFLTFKRVYNVLRKCRSFLDRQSIYRWLTVFRYVLYQTKFTLSSSYIMIF